MEIGARIRKSDPLSRSSFELATLTFRESAPNPEALVVSERVLQAVRPHLTARADALGLARRPALLREESLRVGLRTQSAFLPLRCVTQQVGHDWSAVHQRASFLRTGECRRNPPRGRRMSYKVAVPRRGVTYVRLAASCEPPGEHPP